MVTSFGESSLAICGLMGGLFGNQEGRGGYSLRSFITIQWAFSLVSHRVAQIFLGPRSPPFPFANLYYRMMGAKFGERPPKLNSMMFK
ncbi:MAG: hypothetical protein Ct9H90mP21_2660 [Methanobacteriota archaeon]|nr:MAG: hypothetical protein Ct9H90mP21_2660 [Euryarchaeota archaeon]